MATQKTQQTSQVSSKKLVLHFDIRKTILLQSKLSKEEYFNKIMCKYAWGKVEQKDEKSLPVWKIQHNHFSSKPPQPDLTSYLQFVKLQLPEKTKEQEPNEQSRQEYSKIIRTKRQEQYNNFIKQGGPGIKLKAEYDKIFRSLIIPPAVQNEMNSEEKKQQQPENSANNMFDPNPNISDLLKDNRYNILPQFFKTMIHLKKNKKDFCIVLHSDSSNLDNVIREYNKFCSGEHPCFSGKNNTQIGRFDGQKGTRNYIINQQHFSQMYRYDKSTQNIALATGKIKDQIDKKKGIEEEYEKEIDEESVKIVKGGQEVYEKISTLLLDRCTVVVKDDMEFFTQNNRAPDCGKVLVVDQTDYNIQHIFFDDKITEDEKCIVEVKDLIDGNTIPIKKAINKYLFKVDIIDVLKDLEYFVKAIDVCEKNRQEEIDKIEKGIADEQPQVEVVKKSDFELLQELPDDEYLRRTILPLLHPALRLVDIERPVDPVGFIAMYCLKNINKVKIPQPTQEYIDKKQEEEEAEFGEVNVKMPEQQKANDQQQPEQQQVQAKQQ